MMLVCILLIVLLFLFIWSIPMFLNYIIRYRERILKFSKPKEPLQGLPTRYRKLTLVHPVDVRWLQGYKPKQIVAGDEPFPMYMKQSVSRQITNHLKEILELGGTKVNTLTYLDRPDKPEVSYEDIIRMNKKLFRSRYVLWGGIRDFSYSFKEDEKKLRHKFFFII